MRAPEPQEAAAVSRPSSVADSCDCATVMEQGRIRSVDLPLPEPGPGRPTQGRPADREEGTAVPRRPVEADREQWNPAPTRNESQATDLAITLPRTQNGRTTAPKPMGGIPCQGLPDGAR